MAELTEWIGTLGFPIVMCLLFFYYIYETKKSTDAQIEKLSNSIDKMNDSIIKLTLELQREEINWESKHTLSSETAKQN